MQERTAVNPSTVHNRIDLIHAGARTTLIASYFALIPGVLPTVALIVVVGVILVLPLLVLGLGAAIVAAPVYAIVRLARRRRISG